VGSENGWNRRTFVAPAHSASCYIGILHYLDSSAGIGIGLVATVAALLGAVIGVFLPGAHQKARFMVPFAGGLLVGISLFGLFPELASEIGPAGGLALFAVGYLVLRVINRFIVPVCPSCAHDHYHEACTTALHGFALPLVVAAAVHSSLDGWSIATAQFAAPLGVRATLPMAVVLHKIPEGIALGAILRAAVASPAAALGWCLLAEGVTLVGVAAGLQLEPLLGQAWLSYPLAIAGGFFFYLGFHAVHGEWKRRGAIPALMPALTGAAGAAAVQQGVRALLG
jgi:zinc transporter ZupT